MEKIELFDEKTGVVMRTIRFYNQISFDEFLKGFKAMRYPGYSWRYSGKGKKKENQIVVWRRKKMICRICGHKHPEDEMVGDVCISCASIIHDTLDS